jgi:hypothetical protein
MQPAGIELATPRFKVKGLGKLRRSREFDTVKIKRQPTYEFDNFDTRQPLALLARD